MFSLGNYKFSIKRWFIIFYSFLTKDKSWGSLWKGGIIVFQLVQTPIFKRFVGKEPSDDERDLLHLKLLLSYFHCCHSLELFWRYMNPQGWTSDDLTGSKTQNSCFLVLGQNRQCHPFLIFLGRWFIFLGNHIEMTQASLFKVFLIIFFFWLWFFTIGGAFRMIFFLMIGSSSDFWMVAQDFDFFVALGRFIRDGDRVGTWEIFWVLFVAHDKVIKSNDNDEMSIKRRYFRRFTIFWKIKHDK